MKSYLSLSPQGLATRNPCSVAFNKNAASDNSPHRFGFQRSRLSAAFHPIPWSVGKTMDMLINERSIPSLKKRNGEAISSASVISISYYIVRVKRYVILWPPT